MQDNRDSFLVGFFVGIVVFMFVFIFAIELTDNTVKEAGEKRETCEKTLPRNKTCTMYYFPPEQVND